MVSDGTARFVWRHLVVLGEESIWAAEASECAGDQGRFWDYHDRLFALDPALGRARFSRQSLKQYGAELGLETAQFNSCLDGRRHFERVTSETNEGRRKGVQSTPTFLVGNERVVGIPDTDSLRQLIERQARGRP